LPCLLLRHRIGSAGQSGLQAQPGRVTSCFPLDGSCQLELQTLTVFMPVSASARVL
jgi:hypothetical protein